MSGKGGGTPEAPSGAGHPGQGQPGLRWYRAYRVLGRAPQVIEEVSRFVQRQRLTDTVVSLRVERQPDREFFLFLTLETEQWGEVPEEVEDTLSGCRCLSRPVPEAYTLEQIQRMASGDLQVRALGQCLEYRRVVREAHEDPFGAEARVLVRDAELPAEAGERLLWFLSAAGAGSWSTFRAACAALGVPDAGAASRLARHLRLLGHLELRPGGRWVVAPPAVVEVEGGTRRFLVGARDARGAEGVERHPQPGGPDRLTVTDPGGCPLLPDPAGQLAAALPDAATFRAGLEVLGSVNPAALGVRPFNGLRFTDAPFEGQSGLFELTLPDGRTLHALHGGGVWRRGEFFALRFLALQAADLLGPWRYDGETRELAVRHEERLPEVYERALVLCSGLLPENRGGWLVYRDVPVKVAATLGVRLNVALDLRGEGA